MAHGSAWMIGMRWALRLTGFVSTAILARLLLPEDFGIVAMAAIFAGLLDTAAYTGVDLALIRGGESSRERLNSAWTIQLLQAAIVAVLLIVVAPAAAGYFGEPRVEIVMLWLAVRSVVDGLRNIGVVAFRKELDFAKEFRFNLYAKTLNLVVVVAAAVWFRNYLALVVGMVSSAVVGVALSYAMHPYRPRLSLAAAKGLWSFSSWLLVSRIGSFLNRKADQLVVGGVVGTTAIGNYHVANEFATIPTSEIVMPIRGALYPTLSRLQDPNALRDATLQTFGAVAIACFSLGFGLMATAPEFVVLVLGAQWKAAIPLVEWLAIYGAIAGLAAMLEVPMWVHGKTHVSAIQSWLELLLLLPLLMVAVRWGGVEGAAMARTAIAAIMLPLMMWLTARACALRFADLASAAWRPLAAAILMAVCLRTIVPRFDYAIVALVVKVALGASVFFVAILALWALSGRPGGFEKVVIERIRSLASARRDRG